MTDSGRCPKEPGPCGGHGALQEGVWRRPGLAGRGPWYLPRSCSRTHLEAVVLAQDAAVHRLDDHLLLHAEVQRLHRAAGAEQGLMRARLLQPRHQMGPGGRAAGCVRAGLPCPLPSLLLQEACPEPPSWRQSLPSTPTVLSVVRQSCGEGTSWCWSHRDLPVPSPQGRTLGKGLSP